jgi:hypothetical protein
MRQSKLGDKNFNFGKPRSENFKKIMKEKKSGEKSSFFWKTFNIRT